LLGDDPVAGHLEPDSLAVVTDRPHEHALVVRVVDRERPVVDGRGEAQEFVPDRDREFGAPGQFDFSAVFGFGRERVRSGFKIERRRLARREGDRLQVVFVAGHRHGDGEFVGVGEEERLVVDGGEQTSQSIRLVVPILVVLLGVFRGSLGVDEDGHLLRDVDLDRGLDGVGGGATSRPL